MSYTINLSNGNILTSVPDTQLVTAYGGLDFIGKNYAGFGTALNDNLAHIVENFANSVPPTNPFIGQIWYDTVSESIKFWNGSEFKDISVITTSPTEPLYPQEGDEWFNGTALYIWNGFTWVLIGPPSAINGSKEGFIVAQTAGGTGNIYYLQLWANEEIMAVVSAIDIPLLSLAGFGNIRAGWNFVSIPDPTTNIPTSGMYNITKLTVGINDQIAITPDGNNDADISINGSLVAVYSSQGNSSPAFANLVNGNLGGSVYTNDLFTSNITVLENITIAGNLTVDENLLIDGTSVLVGNVAITSNLSVGNSVSITKELGVGGNIVASQNISVAGNIVASQNLIVAGTANIGTANISGAYQLPSDNGNVAGAPLITNNNGSTQWFNNANLMQFSNHSLITNGYQYFPGGLLMQWGFAASVPSNGASSAISFPTHFTSAPFSITATMASYDGSENTEYPVIFSGVTNSGFGIGISGSGTTYRDCYWIAIGF